MRRVLAPFLLFAGLSVSTSSQQVQPGASDSVVLSEPTVVVVDTGTNATALYRRDSCAWLKTVTSTRRFSPAEAQKRSFQRTACASSGRWLATLQWHRLK
jgi:uncharacterized protein GlcG (DUF336 family)